MYIFVNFLILKTASKPFSKYRSQVSIATIVAVYCNVLLFFRDFKVKLFQKVLFLVLLLYSILKLFTVYLP